MSQLSDLVKRINERHNGFLIAGESASGTFFLSATPETASSNWLAIAENYFSKDFPKQDKASVRIVISNPDSFELISNIARKHGFELLETAVLHLYRVAGADETLEVPALEGMG